jgi:UDP-N-acetylglucosamine 2-epimerase (non-hydrolysing)
MLKSGSPIREIYDHFKVKIDQSTVLESLGLMPKQYFVVSIHRQENVDSPERLRMVLQSLKNVRDAYGFPVLVSTHPRTRKRLEALSTTNLPGIDFHEPFGYLDYNKLQSESFCVISDSGTISEESSIVGFRSVSLRDSIERPEALETGATILAGLDPDYICRSVELALASERAEIPEGYENGDFSMRVLAFLHSSALQYRTWKGLHPKLS